jgi:plasmid stability protein
VTPRKQLSMVLPQELIEAIKQRAAEQGLSITAYVANLVRRDLGYPALPDPQEMAEQLHQLQERVERLEHGDS